VTVHRLAGLRGRLVIAVSLIGAITLGGAFVAIWFAVNRAQERGLDDALLPAADEEARLLASADEPGGAPPVISDRPGPAANDVGPLPKYVAVYWPDGHLASATSNFEGSPTHMREQEQRDRHCFDLRVHGVNLRAAFVGIPQHPGARLLMGVPRADLDGDESFLGDAMLTIFAVACAWTALLTWVIVGYLMRAHRRIVETARRVVSGDLEARVGPSLPKDDPEGLGRNIDEMIERLAVLLRGQQRFIAQAAHELRSPLTTLYTELSLALRRERTAEEYRTTIEGALSGARSLTTLAEDLLTLARLGTHGAGTENRVAVAELIHGAVDSLRERATKRDVHLEVDDTSSAEVAGHPGDLERMIRNLLDNAIRHTPEHTAVLIECQLAGDQVEISVSDDGTGIKPEERDRIFEPFFRGGDVRAYCDGGAGLGLAIARDIARLHGGNIRPERSRRLRGARFVVVLPRFRAS
jgi:two-component system OmpR family sensor kinase